MRMRCEDCNHLCKAFTLKGLGKALERHKLNCRGAKNMEQGEKYFVLMIGDLKIPFFPTESKDGKKYYQARLQLWENTKGPKKTEAQEKEKPEEQEIPAQ